MNSLQNLIHNPLFWMAVYWVYNAAVSSLPEPMPNGNEFYKWFYGFSHILAANIDKLAALRQVK